MKEQKNSDIERRICEALIRIECPDVQVQVLDAGDVQLAGTTATYNDRCLAIAVTRTTCGVRDLTSKISLAATI